MEDATKGHGSHNRIASPADLLELADRAQHGDVAAQHALAARFKPLLYHVIASYRGDPELYQDLEDEVQIIFHRLILGFDPERGASLPTYLALELPLKLRTLVAQQRRVAWREPNWTSFAPTVIDDAADSGEETDAAIRRLDTGEGETARQWSSVEETAIDHLALETALNALSPLQRDVFWLHANGYSS